MRCVHCGMDIPDDANVCPYCHSDTGQSKFAAMSFGRQVGGILFVIGLFVAIMWYIINDDSWAWGMLIPIIASVIGIILLIKNPD